MTIIFEKAKDWYAKKRPFVLYCKPNSDKLLGVFQKNEVLYEIDDFTEVGFAFTSFDGEKKYLIPKDESEIYVEKITENEFIFENNTEWSVNSNVKLGFESLVRKGIQAINENEFQKVVLSRKEVLNIDNFDFELIFRKIIANYSNTFNYCFYHPKIGFWMGATPEQLLQSSENSIKTVSFAGTQSYLDEEVYIWEEKEKKEQQFVTDYILENLEKYSDKVSFSKPYTFRAGSIVHIKTDIEAEIKNLSEFRNIIQKLHPTPAVCGLPKKEAMDFIIDNEGYDRTYYTGFLGELNIDFKTCKKNNSDLFVNLRCMNFEQDKMNIYVGCGITKESNPENEFIESFNKFKTMKKVL